MKQSLCTALGFLFIIFIGLLSLKGPVLTGAVTESIEADKSADLTLHHVITNYYDVENVLFPLGKCGALAQDWYNSLAHSSLADKSESIERNGLLNFETVRGRGTLEIFDEDKAIQLSADVNINSLEQKPVRLDLRGRADDEMYVVQEGKITLDSLYCAFAVDDENNEICHCI